MQIGCRVLFLIIRTDAPFDVEIFVSGFASRSSGPGFNNTRAGRAFLRLARGDTFTFFVRELDYITLERRLCRATKAPSCGRPQSAYH